MITIHQLCFHFDSGENDGSDDATEPPVPKRKSFVGTPQYVSPEILRSLGSSRLDIYVTPPSIVKTL